MVLDSHAIVYPRAVVVEPLYALITDGAVSGPSRSDHLALGTQVCWIDVSEQHHEVLGWFWPKHAWILATCKQEANNHK